MAGFSLRKKAVGAYFNDGEIIAACQVLKDREHAPAQQLQDAVAAARDVFFVVYQEGRTVDPEIWARLKEVLADIRDFQRTDAPTETLTPE